MQTEIVEEELSVKEAFMILDGWKGILEKIILMLPETESVLKSYLCVHVFMPTKSVVEFYNEQMKGIYSSS